MSTALDLPAMALLYERRSGPFPELLDYPLPVLKSAASAAERLGDVGLLPRNVVQQALDGSP